MDNIFTVFKKSVFNTDYSFILRYIPIMSALGIGLHVFFYFFLKYFVELDESILLRCLSVGLILIRPLVLTKNITTPFEKTIYEISLVLLMPFYFSYMTLANDINMFWATATGFCGFFYGLLSKPYIMPAGYITGIMGASIAYSFTHNFDPDLLQANFFLQPVSFFPALIAAFLIIALEHSYKQIIKMKTEQISFLETEKNYNKLKKTEELLRENEEKYRLLVNNSSDAIFVLQDERIHFVNKSAVRITGFNANELLSKSFLDFLMQEDFERAMKLYDTMINIDHAPVKNQFEIIVKDSVHKWVEIDSVFNSWNDKPAVFHFMSDITEKKLAYEELFIHRNNLEELVKQRTSALEEINRELMLAKNDAEAATLSKNEFLANMSHEIRTPMNAVIGISELMVKTDLTPKQQEYVQIVKSSSKILLSLINDILDFSKIEAGQMDFEEIPFLLSEVIDEVSDIFVEKIRKKEIEFIVDISPDVPQRLISDPLRLKQMLTNITANALKFTNKGEITISVSVDSKSNDNVVLSFSVTDTGIGIDKEKIDTLFNAFSQADSSTTRKFGGTGLGLSITKKIAEMMNGTISVESKPGDGSKFTIKARFKYLTGSLAQSALIPQELNKKRVLIVDDNPSTVLVIKRYIEQLGLRAETAFNSRNAIKIFKDSVASKDPFSLIIMDIKMPDQDGITTVEILKEFKDRQIPPVIFISSSDYSRFKERFSNLSPEHYLTKPVKQSMLFDSIMNIFGYLPESKIETDLYVQPDFSGITTLLVEDNAINQMVASEILTSFNMIVHKAGNGKEAIELLSNMAFDLVLMDIQMPEMDGIEATGIIRNELKLNNLPVIAMTANAMRGDKEKYIAAGMNDYIPKPIENSHMVAILKKWIPEHSQALLPEIGSDSEKEALLTEDIALPDSVPGIDIKSGLKRVNNNKVLFLSLLATFREENEHIVNQIKKAFTSGNINTAGEMLHSLKGTSSNISSKKLHATIKNLEESVKQTQTIDDNLFESFADEMATVLESIKPLYKLQSTDSPADSTLPATKNNTAADIGQMLSRLSGMLNENSFDSESYLKKIISKLDPAQSSKTKTLKKRISSLDFESAKKELTLLAEDLDIPFKKG